MKIKLIIISLVLIIVIIGVYIFNLPKGNIAPIITDISPKSGPVGTEVTLIGNNFDLSGDGRATYLFIGGPYKQSADERIGGEITDSITNNQIKFKMPAEALVGKHSISISNPADSNKVEFEVINKDPVSNTDLIKVSTTTKVASAKIIYPNGGEDLIIGQTYDILSKVNLNGGIESSAGLSIINKTNNREIRITSCGAGSTFKWNIPNDIPVGQYKMIVHTCDSWAGGGLAIDESNGYFTISNLSNTNLVSNWKTYKDDFYGFEIKYPPTWNLSENPTLDPESNKIFCPPELTDKNGECMRKETFGHMPGTLAPIFFFQRPENDLNSNNPAYKVLGTRNGFKYELVLGNSSYSKEYELIASSFRFITATTSKVATVKVISPNGGEIWRIGDKMTIKFKIEGSINSKDVIGVHMIPGEIPIAYLPIASSSYEWLVPTVVSYGDSISKLVTGPYKIKVSIYDKIPCMGVCAPGIGNSVVFQSDESDNYFTIAPMEPQKQITVLSPNGGEEWIDKTIHQIVWSNLSTSTNLVDLYLWDDLKCGPYGFTLPVFPTCPQAYITLDKNINTNTIYNWIVGTDIKNNNIPAGKYKAVVCKAGNFYECDFSDKEFNITSK